MPTNPGLVVHLRLNRTDAMAIVDVLDLLGVPKDNLSFAQATKIVLTNLLGSMRVNGRVPNRDNQDYERLIEPFGVPTYAAKSARLRTSSKFVGPEDIQ
jgi:hypothetical protein